MEKAYDRVAWPYLYSAMNAIKIPEKMINWVKTKTNEIIVGQGLQQGDPISPVLFNIAANLLLAMCNTILKGIDHAGQLPLKAMAFAGDTVLGISDSDDAEAVTKLIAMYEAASSDIWVYYSTAKARA